jgi:hypothetical protein
MDRYISPPDIFGNVIEYNRVFVIPTATPSVNKYSGDVYIIFILSKNVKWAL